MRTSHKLTHALLALVALVVMASAALAADPIPGPDPQLGVPGIAPSLFFSLPNDQAAGSLLVYNFYISSLTNPGAEDTRINITNVNAVRGVAVHLFFIDGSNCSVADAAICLTKSQTATFRASDIDPGVCGYLIAIASNAFDGCPINFNYLVGDEYVRTNSFGANHEANLGAEAVRAGFLTGKVNDITCPIPGTGGTLGLIIFFDDILYQSLPRVLAADNIPAPGDGNNTLLIVNRVGGADLRISGAPLGAPVGSFFGLAYDDAENAYSFTIRDVGCQLKAVLNTNFPRTTPRLTTVIPPGRSGWLKLYDTSSYTIDGLPFTFHVSLFGAMINAGNNPSTFNGGHNLHKLTVNPVDFMLLPIFPTMCDPAIQRKDP